MIFKVLVQVIRLNRVIRVFKHVRVDGLRLPKDAKYRCFYYPFDPDLTQQRHHRWKVQRGT